MEDKKVRVLLATDGRECSQKAVKMLSNFAATKIEYIKIISVIDMSLPISIDLYGGFIPSNIEIEKTVRENAEVVLKETHEKLNSLENHTNTTVTTEVLFGSPESRIVETAGNMNADIIIVGSHGYNGWERLLLGSVSDAVIHHAPCSVLVVR